MSHAGRTGFTLVAVVVASSAFGVAEQTQQAKGSQQSQQSQQSQLPNPYRLVENWPTLPPHMNGGRWGELIRAQLDPTGNIWIFHRCFNTVPAGAATCVGRSEPPILQFDPSGQLLASFGEGIFAFPHGFTVDGEGNLWATDANGDETVLGMSARATAGPMRGLTRGHQVFKFSPQGEVLMTLGRAGVAGNGPDTFDRPTGVAVAANGDVFVTDGHGRNDRVVKFSPDGRFIKTWGRTGAGPGEFDQPHDISIGGSQERVFVRRPEQQPGSDLRPGGQLHCRVGGDSAGPARFHVSADDTLYVSDSHSNSRVNPGYTRGITIGSARDGSLRAFIPDPDLDQADVNRISGASGITADAMGAVFAADVGPHRLRKYELRRAVR